MVYKKNHTEYLLKYPQMKSSLKKIKEETVYFENLEIKVSYKKIKNMILKVKSDQGIVLSVPHKISQNEINKFIESKSEWIITVIEKYQKYQEGNFFYLGNQYKIRFINSNSRAPKVVLEDGFFDFYIHEALPEKTKNRYLEKHLEEKIESIANEFSIKWEEKLEISKKSLSIKKLRGKWGYCHTKNHDICLNLELIKKDIKFIEYVVLHELCHIIEPNHGPKFKALLNKHMPDWRKIVKNFST